MSQNLRQWIVTLENQVDNIGAIRTRMTLQETYDEAVSLVLSECENPEEWEVITVISERFQENNTVKDWR